MINKILEDRNPWWRDPHARPRNYPNQRDLLQTIRRKIVDPHQRRAVVLMGPRQVGKTTLLHQLADSLLKEGVPAGNLTYFDFSDDRLTEAISPREVASVVPAACKPDQPRFLLLDEVSCSRRWDAWLKQAVDTTRDRYVVTDSSASLLREGSRESGPGRWDELRMEGLTFPEFLRLQAQPGESVESVQSRIPNALPRYLMLGGFPEHIMNPSSDDVRLRLRSDIADRAILRDLARRNVRDVEKIKALFVYLVQDSGAILNVRTRAEALKAAEDSGADPRSIRGWIGLLEETGLIASIPCRGGGPTRRMKGRLKPKVYASDHGLVCAFSPSPDPLIDPSDKGRIFEAVVYRHLREAARNRPAGISYFRDDDQREIDFVMETGATRIGIEVTSSKDPDSDKLLRLREAGRALRADRLILIHDGLPRAPVEQIEMVQLRRLLLDTAQVLSL